MDRGLEMPVTRVAKSNQALSAKDLLFTSSITIVLTPPPAAANTSYC
jgi:hypothetical protein